jgi:hypothetical protein
MTEESDRMLTLLQELAALKECDERTPGASGAHKKRRKEIKNEMKQLAAQKKQAVDN